VARQRLQGGAELRGLRGGIFVDVDVILALPLVGRIGDEPQPRIGREALRPKADQLLPQSLTGHDPARCRQIGTRCKHHRTIVPLRDGTPHPRQNRKVDKLSISPLYVLIGAPSIRCADIAEAAIMFP